MFFSGSLDPHVLKTSRQLVIREPYGSRECIQNLRYWGDPESNSSEKSYIGLADLPGKKRKFAGAE